MALASEIMAPEPDASGDDRLLFCPFCRECYEGRAQCPEHELALVEFQALPRQAHERQVRWDEPVVPWDIRFGRFELALGLIATLVGFFLLPLAVGTFDDRPVSWTGLEVAMSRAPNLWTVPFAAVLFAVFLYRRRTPDEMRGARLAGALLALMPIASLAYSLWNIERGVEAALGAMAIEWGYGVWAIAAGSLALLAGSLRFGVVPREKGLPHGAEPDEHAGAHIDPERGPPRKKRRGR